MSKKKKQPRWGTGSAPRPRNQVARAMLVGPNRQKQQVISDKRRKIREKAEKMD